MRLSTPPLSPPLIIRASADEEDESITCSKAAGVKTSASMDFDMLFDTAEGASGANERMETVHEDAKDETYSSSDDDVLDPVSVYVRCAPPPVPNYTCDSDLQNLAGKRNSSEIPVSSIFLIRKMPVLTTKIGPTRSDVAKILFLDRANRVAIQPNAC